jgi:hypothetical protein
MKSQNQTTKIDFNLIRDKVREGQYDITVHATIRLRQRGISIAEVEQVILTGEMIEKDPQAKPYPKCIFWGFTLRVCENNLTSTGFRCRCSGSVNSGLVLNYRWQAISIRIGCS